MRATANLVGWRLEITDRTLVCEGITEQPNLPPEFFLCGKVPAAEMVT